MNKLIAILLVVFFPVFVFGMVIEIIFRAIEDSRLYSFSMFSEAIKFHYEHYPLPFKEYGILIKDFWNSDYTT